MFRCVACTIGQIIPRYKRDADPVYRCNHCQYRHMPRQDRGQYKPGWSRYPKKAIEGAQALADRLPYLAPTLIPIDAGTYDWPREIAPVHTVSWWQRIRAWWYRQRIARGRPKAVEANRSRDNGDG